MKRFYYPQKRVGRRLYKAHVLIAEKALGHSLPEGAIVHHVNEDTFDNRNENLVICPSKAYHALIHQRMRALEACGHADWRKCSYCFQYAPLEQLPVVLGSAVGHASCRQNYDAQRYLARKASGEQGIGRRRNLTKDERVIA